jgi:hypothetical protein
MFTLKALASVCAASMLLASPAMAVTVENTSDKEFKIGVDYGNKEDVKTVASQKSTKIDCPDGCGITGPWGYSWLATGNDDMSSDGTSQIVVSEGGASQGAGAGDAGAANANDPSE